MAGRLSIILPYSVQFRQIHALSLRMPRDRHGRVNKWLKNWSYQLKALQGLPSF
jgi:hypothetical protein